MRLETDCDGKHVHACCDGDVSVTGNGVMDTAELTQFWTDVAAHIAFPEGTPVSVIAEHVSNAVNMTKVAYDTEKVDNMVDKSEFIAHLKKTKLIR